jgi:hypothetical protein
MYFLFRMVCQVPSSISNLDSHLPSRAVFLTSSHEYQATLVFGIANNTPFSQSLFLFLTVPLLKDSRPVIIQFV